MLGNVRVEYSVKTCANDDPESLENLLNQMSEDEWELYMLHEAESRSGGIQYVCIFCREIEEIIQATNGEIIDVSDFKSQMERILLPSAEPYDKCLDIQRNINLKQDEINKIKNLLDSQISESDRDELNNKMYKNLKELDQLKCEFTSVLDPEIMYERINQDILTIIISDELLYLVDNNKGGELIAETVKLRQLLTDKFGYVIPGIRFTNLETLEANEYRIDVRNIQSINGTVYPGHLMYHIGQSNINRKPKEAIDDIDAVTGNRVFWIEESKTKNYWEKGLTPAQVISKSLEYVVCRYVDDILNYNDINHYIELVGLQNLFVQSLVPDSITFGDLRYIFANLIREKVSVKDIVYIFEKINDINDTASDKEEILEELRIALSRQICSDIADINRNIYGILISDSYAKTITSLTEDDEENPNLILKHPKISKLAKKIAAVIKNSEYNLSNIAVICPLDIRHIMFRIVEQIIPGLSVLAAKEIANGFNLEIIETI